MNYLRLSSLVLGVALVSSTGCAAADHDFNAVVSSVEQHYSAHPQRIPLMGFVSLCARVATHGGVKGMRVAEFDNLRHDAQGRDLDTQELLDLVRSELGEEWQPMVTERSRHGSELSVVFVRPAGHSMRMLVADYENGELDVVRMELNGSQLAEFMHEPGNHHHHGSHPDYAPENAQ
jgi:hypothetical protein